MSVIVAVEGAGGVSVAWDTGYVSGNAKGSGVDKAWLLANGVGLGLAGDLAAIQALRYSWNPQPRYPEAEGPVPWLVAEMPRWRKILEPWEPAEEGYDMEALVVLAGQVFGVDSGLSVTRMDRGYTAIGSGQAWAEGYLHLALAGGPLSSDVAKGAVRAALEHCHTVGGDVRSLWVPA